MHWTFLLITYLITLLFFGQPECRELNMSFNHLDEARRSLSQCIIHAFQKYFTLDFETVTYSLPFEKLNQSQITLTILNELILSGLESEQKWAFLMKNVSIPSETNLKYLKKSYSYIIQLRTKEEFVKNVEGLEAFPRWNPHAKFLVVSEVKFSHPNEVAVFVIKSLWSLNVINAAVLLADNKNSSKFNVYTWNPYSPHSCGNNFADTVAVDSCFFGIRQTNVDWFRNKIPQRVYKCPVTVKYIVWPPFVLNRSSINQVSEYHANQGIDIDLVNMICDILNLTIIYEKSSFDVWGEVDEQHSTTRDLKLLKENKVDLVVGGYTRGIEKMLFFDTSVTYYQESLVWCVPHTPLTLEFQNLLNVLKLEVWVLMFVLYILTSASMWYMSVRDVEEYLFFKRLSNCFLCNFLVLIGAGVKVLPKTSRVRFLVIIFIVFSLQLDLLYTSYLTSILSSPQYKEKYSTMGEIFKSKLHIYFPQIFLGDISNDGTQRSGVVRQRWRNCTSIPSCLNYLISSGDAAICIPLTYKNYLLKTQFQSNTSAVHCLKENMMTLPLTIIMRKGFPLFNLFDKTMTKVIEAGFIVKWSKDILKEESQARHRKDVTIEFKDLRPIFYVLLVGHVSAILTFISEVVWHYLQFL